MLHVLSILQAQTRGWDCFRALWSHLGPAERQELSLPCAPAPPLVVVKTAMTLIVPQ